MGIRREEEMEMSDEDTEPPEMKETEESGTRVTGYLSIYKSIPC